MNKRHIGKFKPMHKAILWGGGKTVIILDKPILSEFPNYNMMTSQIRSSTYIFPVFDPKGKASFLTLGDVREVSPDEITPTELWALKEASAIEN